MERYALSGGREGYERLRVLAAARRASTVELFRRAGLRSGMRCVDLGCGSGDVTFEMAALAGPAGSAVGIDMDQTKLESARAAARERGLVNVAFEIGDVNQWHGGGGYDFVYCRFLFQHLARPVDLLRRMWAAVRPGARRCGACRALGPRLVRNPVIPQGPKAVWGHCCLAPAACTERMPLVSVGSALPLVRLRPIEGLPLVIGAADHGDGRPRGGGDG